MKKTVKSMGDGAMAAIAPYSIEDAHDLHGRDDVPIIDLRDLRDLREREREGVIPGAFHAPRGRLKSWVDPARLTTSRYSASPASARCCSAPRAGARRWPRRRCNSWA